MLRESRMLQLGTSAPDFTLPDASGVVHQRSAIANGRPLLVAFICNHCPFVRHIARAFAEFAREYQVRGLAVVAINSNDIVSHPDDAPARMAEFAARHGFTFPYLFDESQRVALDFEAICTPDFFLFDAQGKLAYRGRFDASRPGMAGPGANSDGKDMRAAADAVLDGKVPVQQTPSAGCNIKWRPENEPTWA